jgi:dTMP kinase
MAAVRKMEGRKMPSKLAGKFIVLDGPDGCGKTTQLKLLGEWLDAQGIEVVQTGDPGGTTIGNQISDLLKYNAKGHMDAQTEALLFMASRAQLVAEVIRPALEAGKAVLCDRYISSTCAYQGSSGYPVESIMELGQLAVGDIWPDLTIIADISAEEGRARTGHKPYQKTKVNHKDAFQSYLFPNVVPDRFDSRTLEYHRRVRKWFLELGKYYPGTVEVVDGSGSVDDVHAAVVEVVRRGGWF